MGYPLRFMILARGLPGQGPHQAKDRGIGSAWAFNSCVGSRRLGHGVSIALKAHGVRRVSERELAIMIMRRNSIIN